MFLFPCWGFAKEDDTQELVVPSQENAEKLAEIINKYLEGRHNVNIMILSENKKN